MIFIIKLRQYEANLDSSEGVEADLTHILYTSLFLIAQKAIKDFGQNSFHFSHFSWMII